MLVLSSRSRLLGTNPVVWLCDQEPVKTFQKGPPPEKAKLKRWWTYLSQFRLTVHHIPGIKNEMADYISRNNFDTLLGESSEALAKEAFQRMDVQLDLSMRRAGVLEGWSLGQLGLFLVDPNKGFVLRTDASDYAVGAVLEQVRDDGWHVPVAFWSQILAEGQRRTWTAREKETYAIVCALRKWSGHIGLQPVVVCTDHQSLQSWHKEHVDTPSGPAARRARWHETFAKFDLSVVYVPRKDNTVADCLSSWAYPTGKAWMDISSHGDAEETEEAKRIIEMEKAMEQEGVKCFVVMQTVQNWPSSGAPESKLFERKPSSNGWWPP